MIIRLLKIGVLILVGLTANGQTKKGYVDYESVKFLFSQYGSGQNEIDKLTIKLNDSLKLLYNNLIDLTSGCYPQSFMSDSSFRKQREDKLNGLKNKIEEFQKNGLGEIKKQREAIETTIKQIIVGQLKQFSADNDLLCVLDKKSILYCDDCRNLTDDFIAYYQAKRR